MKLHPKWIKKKIILFNSYFSSQFDEVSFFKKTCDKESRDISISQWEFFHLNPFLSNVSFWFPLKSENLFSRGSKGNIGKKRVQEPFNIHSRSQQWDNPSSTQMVTKLHCPSLVRKTIQISFQFKSFFNYIHISSSKRSFRPRFKRIWSIKNVFWYIQVYCSKNISIFWLI